MCPCQEYLHQSSSLAGPDSTVEVIVDSTSWHLHRAPLISHSSMFKSALSEHLQRKIILADHGITPSTTIFTMFVQWLCTSAFNALYTTDLLRAYMLGSGLCANGFVNKIIDKFYAMNLAMCTFTPPDAVTILLVTKAGSGLRRLAVDSIALGFLTQELDVQADDWKVVLNGYEATGETMASMAQQHLRTWKSKRQVEYHDVV